MHTSTSPGLLQPAVYTIMINASSDPPKKKKLHEARQRELNFLGSEHNNLGPLVPKELDSTHTTS